MPEPAAPPADPIRERMERALRKALGTPPARPRKAKKPRGRRAKRGK